MAPLMAGQMPVVVVSLRRRSLAQGAGLTPPSFLPLQPVFPLAPRHLQPTGPAATVISSIPIHLLNLLLPIPLPVAGPWRSLCFLGARS